MPILSPLIIRWLVIGGVALALFVFGWIKGNNHGTAKLTAYQGEQAKAAIKVITKQGAITERVVVKYRERVVKGATVTQTVKEEVIKYVESKPLALSCMLDLRWVRLHDAAVLGAVPPATSGADATTGAISAAAALPIITDNYAASNRNSDRLEALQEWAREQGRNRAPDR